MTLALCAACKPAEPGDTEDTSGSTGTASTSVSASDTGVGEDSATSDPTTGGDDTGGSDDTAGSDDTGSMFPAECTEKDPSVSAAFALDLTGWPIDPENHEFTASCTIDEVTGEPGAVTVSTALTCELDGMQGLVAVLDIAAPAEGPVSWSAGVAVTLSVERTVDFLEGADVHHVLMRRDDDELLISAVDSTIDELIRNRFAPVAVDLVRVCGESFEFSDEPLRVDFALPEAIVGIVSGQRDRLPISEDQVFVIDVEQATTSDIHIEQDMQILLRRVDSST